MKMCKHIGSTCLLISIVFFQNCVFGLCEFRKNWSVHERAWFLFVTHIFCYLSELFSVCCILVVTSEGISYLYNLKVIKCPCSN